MIGTIATPVAFLLQVTGGVVLALAVGDATNGGISLDPPLAAAYGAIGALFSLVVWLSKGRIERCEKREDTLLSADTDKTATMRELTGAVNKSADVVVSTVDAQKMVGQKLDTLAGAVTALTTKLDDVTRRIDYPDSTPRRRS